MRARKLEGGKPEGLDGDRVALAGGAGGVVGVHPGEVGRAEDEPAVRVHGDAVGGAADIAMGEGNEDLPDGAAAGGFVEEAVAAFRVAARSATLAKNQSGASEVSRLESSWPRIMLGRVPSFS